jgi:hypothetical protein
LALSIAAVASLWFGQPIGKFAAGKQDKVAQGGSN